MPFFTALADEDYRLAHKRCFWLAGKAKRRFMKNTLSTALFGKEGAFISVLLFVRVFADFKHFVPNRYFQCFKSGSSLEK